MENIINNEILHEFIIVPPNIQTKNFLEKDCYKRVMKRWN